MVRLTSGGSEAGRGIPRPASLPFTKATIKGRPLRGRPLPLTWQPFSLGRRRIVFWLHSKGYFYDGYPFVESVRLLSYTSLNSITNKVVRLYQSKVVF